MRDGIIVGKKELDAYEMIAVRAIHLFREWSHAHPFDTDPTDAVESIAASCVPIDPVEVKAAACCAGIDSVTTDDETSKENGGLNADSLRVPLAEFIEEELWREWDVITGERELMNDFEDDLD